MICPCNNLSVCHRENKGKTDEAGQRGGKKEAGAGGGVVTARGNMSPCPERRGEHDMHRAVVCARVTGWGCARLCQNV